MTEEDVLNALIDAWQQEVAPIVRKDCCILAARCTSAVLDYFGIGNKVLACEAFVFNTLALDELERGNDDPKQWPEGAWSIGVGRHSPGKGYAGHVIVRTESGALVDLSAGQFYRRGRIDIDGPRVWVNTVQRDDITFVQDGSAVLSFRPSASSAYRNAPDWRRGREEAARIIRIINGTVRNAR